MQKPEAEETIVKNREQAEELERDRLTGLYGRSYFCEKAQEMLTQGDGSRRWCLMMIDIEHFKIFNEWYGTQMGNAVLSTLGDYLKKTARETGGFAGYFGADDFGILLPDEVETLEKIQQFVIAMMRNYGKNNGFLPTFGIYEAGDGKAVPVTTMCDMAEIALGVAKGNPHTRVNRFEPSMMQRMEEEQKLLTDVKRALAEHEFVFFLQPKCNMFNGRLIGLEALVRWNHKEKGLLSPGMFVPILEKTGLISELDSYVWEEVCKWQRKRLDEGKISVPTSVNVSRINIFRMDVVARFEELIEKYGLQPEMLEIEITESVYAEELGLLTEISEKLHKAGFRVLMDDFGSGYSSLNMLKDVEVDVLKLDMGFLKMDENSAQRAVSILKSVINLSGDLGIRVLAEGVETEGQRKMLLDMGCGYGQGYFFYRPMPVSEVEALLEQPNIFDFVGCHTKTEDQRQKEELQVLNLKLENALRLAGVNSIDWDMRKHTLTLMNLAADERLEKISHRLGTGTFVLEPMPQCLMDSPCILLEQKHRMREFMDRLRQGRDQEMIRFDMPLQGRGGERIHIGISCQVVCDRYGIPARAVGFYTNVTERFEKERRLIEMAQTDVLTGLHNRRHTIPEIQDYLRQHAGEPAALLVIDLDNFKRINEKYGHARGDGLITEVGKRIREVFRREDIVGRLGSDEFIVLCKNIEEENLLRLLNRIIGHVSVDAGEMEDGATVSVSVGYALIPEQGCEFEDLYHKADRAMFAAKQNGKNQYEKYGDGMKQVRSGWEGR